MYFTRVLLAMGFAAAVATAQSPIATSQYNTDRTSANTTETSLNVNNVNQNTFGKLFSWQVDGYIFAQPLYVPNVNGRNVVIIATMNNTLYAFDASSSSSTPIWKTSLGTPVTTITMSCPIFNSGSNGPQLGILSTPVIDTSSNTLYAVSSNPGTNGYVMNLYAVDITTGSIKSGPAQIANDENGTVVQRTGLLLSNGKIYAALGSCGNDSGSYTGSVLVYNISTQQITTFNATAFSSSVRGGGGIWQSGGGGVLDSAGNVYYSSGNALSTSPNNDSSSVIKLTSTGSLSKVFTPSGTDDSASILNANDLDLSGAGPLQIPANSGLLVAGGKQGKVYLLNESDLSLKQSFWATTTCTSPVWDGCFQIHHMAFWNNILYVWGGLDILRAYSYSPASQSFNTTPKWTQNITVTDKRWAPLAVSANGTDPNTGILWATTDTGTVYAFNAATGTQLWNSTQNSARDSIPSPGKFGVPTVANGRVYVVSNACTPARTCPGVNQIAVYGLLPLADFTISAAPGSQTISQGGSTSYSVTITPVNGFNGNVALSVAGAPSGVTASFNPPSITGAGSSMLNITSTSSATLGNPTLVIHGVSGNLDHAADVTLVVQQTPQTDTTPPTWTCCTVLNSDPSNYTQRYTAQDTGAGMKSITVDQAQNASVNIPAFSPGATGPIPFTIAECCGSSSYVGLQLNDVAGNIAYLDSWRVTRQTGSPQTIQTELQYFIPAAEHNMRITNGNPGVTGLDIYVNSVRFHLTSLKDGEVRNLDVSSALKSGDSNTIAVSPGGKPGGFAHILLSNTSLP